MSNYGKSIVKPGYWYGSGHYAGSRIYPNVGVIHTTEGTSLPTYSGGSSAPHYTAVPDFKAQTLTWVAHFPDEQSARALRNESGGVETNTLNCIQIELVGTCDRPTSKRWGATPHIFWPEAPDWALRSVAEFVADMNRRHKIPLNGPPASFVEYPNSYGTSAAQRMSGRTWMSFKGWCGHQHVPENSHGDPGNIAWTKIEQYARQLVAPEVRKSPTEVALSLVQEALNVLNIAIKKKNNKALRLRAARRALRLAKRALEGETQ